MSCHSRDRIASSIRLVIVHVFMHNAVPFMLPSSKHASSPPSPSCHLLTPLVDYVSTSIVSAVAVISSSLSSDTVTYLLTSSLVMIFSFSTAVVPFWKR